ncbi:MAG: glycosyltransferase family 4 protein [Lachnospiraceae bacterium]|nr:glycosyltransferase family 4 protein [Muribaculaceae bacterium]MCM1409741.1 glycosyltransferase family 4 protein [Lachnospiraceae bacterium]
MKKILIITAIGGFLPQFEMNDVKILMEQGYEVHYASNFANPIYELDMGSLEQMGIRLHPIDIQKSPLRFLRNMRALREIISILRKEKIGVVHCHNPMGGALGRLAAMACGPSGPYVLYTAHGFHFYDGAPLLNWLLFFPAEYLLARHTDTIITINGEDDARARRCLAGKRKEVYRIPGVGVETSRFAPDPDMRKEVRKTLGIRDGIFYILSVGELNRNKNHEVIIRAIASLHDPDICYGICGKGYRQGYLEELARKEGIEDQVKLFGFRNDIPRMLQGADCFVFPSRREGLGIAALEAMAAGLPMITSDCRGTREYMEDNVTGYMCRSGQVSEYARLIKKMKDNPEKRAEMSCVCHRVAENFNLDRTDRIMREIYGGLKQ